MASKQPKVVIVGAGMAGLSAAASLADQGFTDLVLFEASDRIGGRIHTVSFGDGPFPIELGANWIHGATRENSSFELADRLGVLSPYRLNNRFSCRLIREDGTEIDRQTAKEAWHAFQRVERKLRSLFPKELSKSRSETTVAASLQSALERLLEHELNDYVRRYPESRGKMADMRRAFNAMKNHLTFHEGDDLQRVAWLEDFDDMMGGDVHIPGGYGQVLNHLASRLPEGCLRLNSEVVKIRMQQAASGVEVSARNGAALKADHVIVTCSLGYLKRHHASLFEPSLPAEKVDVINRMGFGRVNKIFLEFDRPITSPTYRNIGFAWDHVNIGTGKEQWHRKIFGFDQVFTSDTILLGWVASDGAEHLETLTDKEIGDTCTKLLRKFLRDESIPYPRRVLVSRWCSNPFVLGCYSYTTPVLRPGDNQRLLDPVCSVSGEPKILFAGEATMREYGCTHSARTSGIQQAQRICDLYERPAGKSKL